MRENTGSKINVLIRINKGVVILDTIIIVSASISSILRIMPRGHIQSTSVFLEIILLSLVLLLAMIIMRLSKRLGIENSSYVRYLQYFFVAFELNTFIELLEDVGIIPYYIGDGYTVLSLINDFLYPIILGTLFCFLEEIVYTIGDRVKRNLLESPFTLLALVIVLVIPSVFIFVLVGNYEVLNLNLFIIGDTVSSTLLILVGIYYLSKIYNYTVAFIIHDFVDLINSLILLVIGYGLIDAVEDYVSGGFSIILKYLLVLNVLLALMIFLILVINTYNVLPLVNYMVKYGIRRNDSLLLLTGGDPIALNTKVIFSLKTLLNRLGANVGDSIIVFIGEPSPIQKLLFKTYYGEVNSVIVNIVEHGVFRRVEGYKDVGLNVLEKYYIAPSITHLVGVIEDIIEKYYGSKDSKRLVLVFNTLTDLILMLNMKRAFLALKNILSRFRDRFDLLVFIVLEKAHDKIDIELLQSLISHIIRI